MHLVILSLVLTVNGGRRIFFPATTLGPSLSVTPNSLLRLTGPSA